MGEEYTEVEGLDREDVVGVERGEVIEYQTKLGSVYLIVDHVDQDRGVVTGAITHATGVNALSIDELVANGKNIAKWGK